MLPDKKTPKQKIPTNTRLSSKLNHQKISPTKAAKKRRK